MKSERRVGRWRPQVLIGVVVGLVFVGGPGTRAAPVVQHIAPEPDFSVPLDLPLRLGSEREAALARYEAHLWSLLERRPDDRRLRYDLGIVLFHQGKRKEATQLWQAASAGDPNLPSPALTADLQDVFGLLAKGDLENGRARLAEVGERYAADPHFHLARAEQALRSGNREEAEKSLRQAVELAPALAVASLRLGEFYEQTGRMALAREHYEKAVASGATCTACWRSLGALQLRMGEVAAARDSFRRAQESDGHEPRPEVRVAMLRAAAGDLVAARHWYKVALANNPPEADAIRAALAGVLLRLRQLDEARAEIEAVLASQEVPALMIALGYIEEAHGNLTAAEALYRRAWALSPDNVIANNNLAMLLIRTRGSPDEILKLARIARLRQPDSAEVAATFACALFVAGHFGEASPALIEAIQSSPDDPWLRFFYGQLLHREGKSEESRIQLQGALILDPAFPRRDEIVALFGG